MRPAPFVIIAAGFLGDLIIARWVPSPWWAPDLVLIALVFIIAHWSGASDEELRQRAWDDGRWKGLLYGAVAGSVMAWLSVRDAAAIGAIYLGIGSLVGWVSSMWELQDRSVCRTTVALGETAVVAAELALTGQLTFGLLMAGALKVVATVMALPVFRVMMSWLE